MSWSWPPPAIPDLIAICGRNRDKAEEAALKFGYDGYYTDWKKMVKDPRIEIFNNCSPDDTHHEPSIAALKCGKHVICEKPLAMNVEDAKEMYLEAKKANVKHMCAHNYRFIPAVRLAREIIEKGLLGDIYEFKIRYLQPYGADPFEPVENVWYASGTKSGVMLGIGSHIIDMARFLVGEISSVFGKQSIFNRSRPKKDGKLENVDADESNIAIVEFESGAVGTIEASCINAGRKNQHIWEIYGSKGSMSWDLEDLNHLYVNLINKPAGGISGFTKVNVTDPGHPFSDMLWPPGHNMGWECGHVNEILHFVDAVVNDTPIEPYGATFYDGYIVQVIMEAIKESSLSGKKMEIRI
ncbi:MAG TPA: dehydrogenase [Actinobacteria bacterium]|nr:dehydrogenase [Actinomycetota bacterium]